MLKPGRRFRFLTALCTGLTVGVVYPFVDLALACRAPGSEACVWGKAYLPLAVVVSVVVVVVAIDLDVVVDVDAGLQPVGMDETLGGQRLQRAPIEFFEVGVPGAPAVAVIGAHRAA